MIVALTGATGFVGKAVTDHLLARGHQVRALTRRTQSPRDGIDWIEGNLGDTTSLARLATNAEAVLHVAGVVNGTADAFTRGNVGGTRNILAAAASADVERFVHVSSLAAREPHLSMYGRSKADAEAAVIGSDRDWTIVRPPAVYGPGDLEMRDLFRMAKLGIVLLPPAGRVSVIHVADLARLLVALVEDDPGRHVYECDDGVDGGYAHRQLAAVIGAAVGRKPVAFSVPRAVLNAAARADRLFRRDAAKLTPDRAAYLSHPDWTARPDRRPPASLWSPTITTPSGLGQTAAWYRQNQLL